MTWIGVAIVALTVVIIFVPVLQGEFLHWDDDALFVQNSYYRGLGLAQWQWMCTTFLLGHWQPLSWLSCTLDYAVWGMNPHGWHATNLLLHTGNAVLVYLLCLAFFKERKMSHYTVAVLAALFYAVHPLRVEAVAWLATRGYLLCGTFCLLTVLFYLRAVDRKRYPFAALLCFTLATAAKGIGMMLPLILLLIDWRPLRRITSVRTALMCGISKTPFLLLSLLAGVMAFQAKKTNGGMSSIEHYGIIERFGQAIYGIWFYLFKTVSPLNLSPLYYKRPEAGAIMVALLLTAVTMVLVFFLRTKIRPVLVAAGSFMLLIFPMIGFTQSGSQLFADRFTYLAAVPFSVLLASGLSQLRVLRRLICGAAIVLLIFFCMQTAVWAASWSHNLALWSNAVSVDKNNARAYSSSGWAFIDCKQYEKALECFERAIQLEPECAYLHDRSLLLMMMGRYDEALKGWESALSSPGMSGEVRAKILLIRGWVFEQIGNVKSAESDYSAVADDDESDPHQRMGALQLRAALYARTGRKETSQTD